MMLITSHDASSVLAAYPERNPFLMNPPLHNLSPPSQKLILEQLDTPEFLNAALFIARSKGMNPLCPMYFSNPLTLQYDHLWDAPLPFVAYRQPPPLTKITLPADFEPLQQINKEGNTVLLTVRVDDEVRLLKIFPCREPDMVPNIYFSKNPGAGPTVHIDRFEQERDAYAHFIHYGVCEKGVVPRCYGWLELSQSHLEHIASFSDVSAEAKALPHYRTGPTHALLLEYFPHATRLTQDILTEEIADTAMRGMAEIHSAYILHGDVYTRNMLVLPGNRVVWVDFDRSSSPAGKLPCTRQELWDELRKLWSKFYVILLPDKRIGYYTRFDV